MTTSPDPFVDVSAAHQWAAAKIHLALACELEDAQIDSEALLLHTLQRNRSFLITHPDHQLSEQEHQAFCDMVAMRCTGKPTAYITGTRGFWTLDLAVNEHTLIPRPDTETLVDAALNLIPSNGNHQVLDMGTGSGAIALALASERPSSEFTATDISQGALDTALLNATRHGISNVAFFQGSWFEALDTPTHFHLIVSNPPYIATNDQHLLDGSLDHEPYTALASGIDGLDDIRLIVKNATNHLLTNGHLLLEHGYDQGQSVREIMLKQSFRQVITIKDFGNNDRVTLGQWCSPT